MPRTFARHVRRTESSRSTPASTPARRSSPRSPLYMYSTWGLETEARAAHDKKKVMILGGGPNRIGQGIEFDYCCVHASFALKEMGFETIMVNCNPETVSTDYDTSDKLYFEPLTFEDVMHIVEMEKPDGIIVQFGGQTPLKLAVPLSQQGVPILGTSADAIDRAEDRRALRGAAHQAQPQSAARRHRQGHQGRLRGCGADRLPGRSSAKLCARWARHGNRPLSGRAGAIHDRRPRSGRRRRDPDHPRRSSS